MLQFAHKKAWPHLTLLAGLPFASEAGVIGRFCALQSQGYSLLSACSCQQTGKECHTAPAECTQLAKRIPYTQEVPCLLATPAVPVGGAKSSSVTELDSSTLLVSSGVLALSGEGG